MKQIKILGLLVLVMCMASHAFAVTKTWTNTGGDGSWLTATNWSPSGIPASTDDVLLDNSGLAGTYTVTCASVTATSVCKSLTIGYPGNVNTITCKVTGAVVGGFTITNATSLGATTATDTLLVDQGGVFHHNSSAGVVFNNLGGIYNRSHFKSGGTLLQQASAFSGQFPTSGGGGVTFDNGSLMNWASTGGASFSGRTFGNMTFSFTGTITGAGTSFCKVLNTLTINSGAVWNPVFTNTAAANYWVINNIVMNSNTSSNFNIGTAGCVFTGNISGSGTGSIIYTPAAAATLYTSGTLSVGSKLQLASLGTLQVTTGTLNIGASTPVTGAGACIVSPGTTLGIADVNGLSSTASTGAVQVSGTRTFNTTANYTYNGSSAQATGNQLPATANGLTFSNAAGVTLTNSATATNKLALTAGVVTTGANTLTGPGLAGTFTVGTGSVNGTLARTFDATVAGSRTFPMTTATGTATVAVNVTTPGTGTGTFTVKATGSAQPNVADNTNTLAKYWTLTPSGISGVTATLTFNYAAADVVGPEASYLIGEYNGSTYTDYTPTTLDTTNHIASISGITTFSDWTLGTLAALPVELSHFSAE